MEPGAAAVGALGSKDDADALTQSPHDDPQYTQMRNQARHEGDIAHKCFADSQNAYKWVGGAIPTNPDPGTARVPSS